MKTRLPVLGLLLLGLLLLALPARLFAKKASPAPASVRIIDGRSWDPSGLPAAAISAAADLDVYFQHASVGANVLEGLRELAAKGGRYRLGMTTSSQDSSRATWFDGNSGVNACDRGNPGGAEKLNIFVRSMGEKAISSRVDVAMWKLCYIDTPDDPDAFFEKVKTAMEALEKEHPSVAFVFWTMPIERDSAPAARQRYNDLVREYCRSGGKWLLDIADIESRDASGKRRLDGAGRELLVKKYTDDGGHLSASGRRRLALAWWRLMAEIAKTRA